MYTKLINKNYFMTTVKLESVENFWSQNPCGSKTALNEERKRYFQNIENYRYNLHKDIIEAAGFENYSGKHVLEVGCGVGTDGRQFAKNGAIYTGINLDDGSTNLAKENFETFNLQGTIIKMNAEEMKFPDSAFDHIYSLGVIHHSPNTEKIIAQMYRVLKPGGTLIVMIYNKTSVNYYFNIMFIRKVFRHVLRPKWAPKFFSKIIGLEQWKLERHREIMLGKKLTKQEWISINTDGPDCPLAKVYNKNEAIIMFKNAGFVDVETFVRGVNRLHFGYFGKLIPNFFANYLGKFWGWSRYISANKRI